MRIEFLFRCEKLPIIYRHRFLSLIKESLAKSDPQLKELLYPSQTTKTKMPKPFTFAVKIPHKKNIAKEKIEVEEGIVLEEDVFHFDDGAFIRFFFSSYDYNFIVNLYNGILALKEYQLFDGVNITFIRAIMVKEPNITENTISLKTLSPVLIEDKEEKPILPKEHNLENFNEQLNEIENRIKKELLGEKLKSDLKLTPKQIKEEKVKLSIRNHRKENPILMFTPFSGSFILEGNPEDLNFLYQKGIGLRTAQGFGMVEVL